MYIMISLKVHSHVVTTLPINIHPGIVLAIMSVPYVPSPLCCTSSTLRECHTQFVENNSDNC